MDTKYLEEFVLIDYIKSLGIEDDEEILKILKKEHRLNEESAIMILSKYYDDMGEIRKYIKRNKNDYKKTFELGE